MGIDDCLGDITCIEPAVARTGSASRAHAACFDRAATAAGSARGRATPERRALPSARERARDVDTPVRGAAVRIVRAGMEERKAGHGVTAAGSTGVSAAACRRATTATCPRCSARAAAPRIGSVLCGLVDSGVTDLKECVL
jgi:hypothetical protein